ncbi:hypothetical protein D5085_17825 [Ectothiorhodospiraceae bacterium BW-2]|nr:hypothetical protein D5085_17825 [Ectothiorhodospiraceae bacterium BW-2]
MTRCPVCRAREPGAQCPRCGTDFSSIIALQAEAKTLLQQGIWLAGQREYSSALKRLHRAKQLHDTELTRHTMVLLHEQLLELTLKAMLDEQWSVATGYTEAILATQPHHPLAKVMHQFSLQHSPAPPNPNDTGYW